MLVGAAIELEQTNTSEDIKVVNRLARIRFFQDDCNLRCEAEVCKVFRQRVQPWLSQRQTEIQIEQGPTTQRRRAPLGQIAMTTAVKLRANVKYLPDVPSQCRGAHPGRIESESRPLQKTRFVHRNVLLLYSDRSL